MLVIPAFLSQAFEAQRKQPSTVFRICNDAIFISGFGIIWIFAEGKYRKSG